MESKEVKFGIFDLINVVLCRWKISLFVGFILAGAFMFYAANIQKLYEASAQVTVEFDTENITDFTAVMDDSVEQVNLLDTIVNTYIEKIKTRAVAERVVEELDDAFLARITTPFFDVEEVLEERALENDGEVEPFDYAGFILKFVSANGEEDSQIITIAVSHPDPEVAMLLANLYVDTFVELQTDIRSQTNIKAVEFLGQQVDSMHKRVKEAEKNLQDYRRERNLVSVDQSRGVMSERVDRIGELLTQAQIDHFETQSKLDELSAAGEDVEMLLQVSFVGENEEWVRIYQRLLELKRERVILEQTYLRKHPKLIANQASIDSLNQSLKVAVQQFKKRVESEFKNTRARIDNLESELDKAETAVLDSESAFTDYRMLEAALANQRDILQRLLKRYNETSIAQNMAVSRFSILNKAELPKEPSTLSFRNAVLMSGALVGITLIGLPLVIELFDRRLKSFSDIEVLSGKPLLGHVREFKTTDSRFLAQEAQSQDPVFAESFRAIYSSLHLKSDLAGRNLSYVVTSALPGEGKSTMLCNLASSLTRHGYKVLVVDADLRRPVQHKLFGVDNETGIMAWYDSELQCDPAEDPMAVKELGIKHFGKGLYLLPSGGVSANPTEVISSSRAIGLFRSLKSHFDIILYDTPPAGIFPDATLVADFANETIFIARQFVAKRDLVTYAIHALNNTRAPVVGVIFNGVKNHTVAIGYGVSGSTPQYASGYQKNFSKYRSYYQSR